MHNPESVLENKSHKLLWDFEKQTDYLISARRSDFVIINKKKNKKNQIYRIVDFAVTTDHGVKLKESKKKERTSTLLGNWKNCGIWKWCLNQL